MPIKTFRGLLADSANITINLATNDGKIGYMIRSLQLMAEKPGAVHNENVVKVYTAKQTSVDAEVNFEDQTLVGAAFYTQDASRVYNPSTTVVFDKVIFNQDIYITHKMVDESGLVNYYLELEQVKLNDNETTMATLQSIKTRREMYFPAGPT